MTKTALITGASRGLGAALAEALSPSHHVIAVGRTTGALEELDDRIQAKGGSATLAPMDITNADAMAVLCRGIHDRWGTIDLWLHTAIHAAPMAPADHIDAKDMAKSVAGNVTATATLISYVAPLLGQTGQAVFFDDPRAGQKFFGAYASTKAAQIALARAWAAETTNIGPKVKIVTPAPMPTATRARFFPGEDRTGLSDCHKQAAAVLAQL
ncbi:Oxidoreductase, short-chain dehydrogenase/reductase family protein [Sulfitobacter noctilucicola]|uniref:NAD(P)-dependent dehydrogenase (Short-subunit alcohol dehydrogenase family) n=1 Tax=Sulfitobacter noctilucicola TaxID=1342301 RepID=A0A7W6M880_9RHOB|nr:SDR family oxidoreductase [Sulfitobacter noctilucicola]KIN64733.1 Oxidoreductase, short-chain dehydrogenase/reductase family protein [Sulfitobacter noctilucicola]MBB4174121.1 NAD(P)-dependent dehydrogenase (short-subunit alcohol dehydrogenase family) [Sulfitobacter noctilucicola]